MDMKNNHKSMQLNTKLVVSIKIILLITIAIVLTPSSVWASGGGPLLLLFNGSVFVIGQIWIIGVEFLIYRRMVSISKQDAFWDIFSANLLSTVAIAFGLPILIAIIGLAGNLFHGHFGELMLAFGTWVYENSKYSKIAVYMAFFWFVLLFILTVFFETLIFKMRWKKRNFLSNLNPLSLCWYTNALSHLGLLIAILIIWHELI